MTDLLTIPSGGGQWGDTNERYPPLTPDNFTQTLRELGLTQARFGAALGVHTRTVQKWVGRSLPIPRYATVILRLMLRFELSIEDIEQI